MYDVILLFSFFHCIEHVQRRCKVKQLKAESGKQHKRLFPHRAKDDYEISESYNIRNKGIFFPYHPLPSFQSNNVNKDEELMTASFANILPQAQHLNSDGK